ncbi:phosphohistidine phosphatase SixA [Halomonas urumqiensis]|uniref:Phosphohistidine phosphatase SixA n=1 Tax=Halomonas urumqiensis TaxID=1684789 RepID=A0A2N7UHK7_9GAMM|nr:phosphohistidine phosphatase SixA [Halomonas urumqiensis]PMR79914.1 phosphohistidine phosphatase SixA [Halomonas urumqiensis]PTB02061.1 phosphohistidine phosphatase SixA [Halomonas urumqiensis]GHE21501.1 phosphohistidine phosphatase SixA [Halomonas urumqiensis]
MTEPLLIMRHGEASHGRIDEARELNGRGRQEVARMAAWLSGRCDLELARLRLVASPYVRARQTAELIAEGLADLRPQREIETLTIITPDDAPNEVIDWLLEQPDDCPLLLISHMPLVAALTGILVEGRAERGPGFTTATVAELDAEVRAAGCARATRFTSPMDLA